MSSLITVIGDPHLKSSNIDTFLRLTEIVESMNNDVVWLGDMLDAKEIIRGKCLNTLIEYFKTSKLQHRVLVGNHDWFNLDCEGHSLEALKLLNNVEIIDSPCHNPGAIGYLPYIHDQKELKAAIAQMKKDYVHYIFGHLELKSFDFGNGHICKGGLTTNSFSSFKHVISGHFHKYQTKNSVTYLGTPFSHSFGESNQDKFIGVFDPKTGHLDLKSTSLPRHITVEINCDTEAVHDVAESHKGWFKLNYYRIILCGTQENIDKFPKDKYNEFKNVKWITRPSDFNNNEVLIEDTKSNEEQFIRWATEAKNLDKEVIDLGIEILGAVK